MYADVPATRATATPPLPCPRLVARHAPRYGRGKPEQSVLYQVLQEHLATFLSSAGDVADGSGVPRFVEKELRAFLDCGVLSRGLIRLHCGDCGKDQVIGLSCKGRGFCPRCGGRRMAEVSAHLIDHVIPHVPVRQWVLTLPHRLRYRLGYDHDLCRGVLRIFNRALSDHYRNHCDETAGKTGSVTFLQRFNSGLALSPHFHVFSLDGVFVDSADGEPRLIVAPQPSSLEVAEVLANIYARVNDLLRRQGVEGENVDESVDALATDSPALAACYGGSVTRRSALGAQAGKRVVKLGGDPNAPWVNVDRPRHDHYRGFDLHADVAVAAHDRQGLERLLRYGARPAISSQRLSREPDGRVALALKRRYHDGTRALVFEPTAFIEHLAALIPRPHKNLVIYSGVLAPNAKLRSRVVAYGREQPPSPADSATQSAAGCEVTGAAPSPQPASKRANYTWAELMRRTFAVDVLQCPDCGGRLQLLAAVMSPAAIGAILASLGLPTQAPEMGSARGPPETWESA